MFLRERAPFVVTAACIYCRLSYAPDGSVEKVERQEADCRALAERLGWPVCCVYSDNSRSAWQRNRKRPEWDEMLTTLQPDATHRHDAIIVYHGDRLIRQPYDLELLLRLADDRHIPLASVSGVRDLMNEDDRYILRIEAAQACRQSADTSRRVRRGWQARAEKGLPMAGSCRPFGYGVPTGRTGVTGKPIYDLTKIVPEEAAILREAAQRLLAGESKNSVVRWMNSVCTTTTGGRWTPRGLTTLLSSPRVAGLIERDGRRWPGVWEPIISADEWESLRALFRRLAKEHPNPGPERRWMLSGIAACGLCGAKMKVKPLGGHNKGTRTYHCPNPDCRGVNRDQRHLDAYVGGAVVALLNDEELLDRLHQAQDNPEVAARIAVLEQRKARAERALENLADEDEDVDPALLVKSISGLSRRIAELREQLAADHRQRLLLRHAGISWEQWERVPVSVKASIVEATLRVTVLPVGRGGRGFDPRGVRLEPV